MWLPFGLTLARDPGLVGLLVLAVALVLRRAFRQAVVLVVTLVALRGSKPSERPPIIREC